MEKIPWTSILTDVGPWADAAMGTVRCPTCGEDTQHFKGPVRTLQGRDAYKVDWGGRGDLLVIPFWGECGSKWELCLGFHKGATALFGQLIESCHGTQPESA